MWVRLLICPFEIKRFAENMILSVGMSAGIVAGLYSIPAL
jgi:hypothetical protein